MSNENEQIQEAKKYLGEQGYRTGSNFTVNAVANLMAEWAAKNCTIPVVMQRSELLLFADYSESDKTSQTTDECVDNYLAQKQ